MKVFGKKMIYLMERLRIMIQITHKLEDTKDNFYKVKSMAKAYIFGEVPLMRANSQMTASKAKVQLSLGKLFLKDTLNLREIF
jgi:hypothetical protein